MVRALKRAPHAVGDITLLVLCLQHRLFTSSVTKELLVRILASAGPVGRRLVGSFKVNKLRFWRRLEKGFRVSVWWNWFEVGAGFVWPCLRLAYCGFRVGSGSV